MALFVKDPEVDRLAAQLAERRGLTKTEIVRLALQREWAEVENEPSLVEKTLAFARALRARSHPEKGLPADKAFIDSLYED